MSNIESIPRLVYFHLILFLPPRDAVNLSRCSRSLYHSIPFVDLKPPQSLDNGSWDGEIENGDDFVLCYPLPVWSTSRVHSILFSCQWRDQGWGNRKSRLAVVAFSQSMFVAEQDQIPFRIDRHHLWGGGRLVYITPTDAPHGVQSLRFALPCPREKEVYMLYNRAGGGGGHQIRISDVTLQTFIFDNEDRSFSNTFRALKEAGVLRSDDQALLGLKLVSSSTRMLLCNNLLLHQHPAQNAHCTELMALLKEYGFRVDENSVRALDEIRHFQSAEQAFRNIATRYNHTSHNILYRL